MSTVVVLGCADQGLSYELRSQLTEIGDVEIAFVAESTSELVTAVLRFEPDVVFIHDQLGPQPVLDVMRDLGLRRPGSASLIVTSDTATESYISAMEAGARGVVPYPLSFEEVQGRLIAAVDWARTMQRLVSGEGGDDAATGRANVVAFSGAKGGVGTTTLAVHMGLDVVREVRGHRVVLVDLDLEKGDVSSLLEVRYRTSVADLAKVADDLSVQTVLDAVVPHESGLHLLLTPQDVREVEFVGPQAVRRIVTALRQHYDLVLLDVGSHATPVQAAAVEISDEVLVVSTPDVLSLRTMRRNLDTWETLGVRKPDTVRVLLNKASKHDEVQPDTVRKLAQAPVVSVGVPAMFRKLEPSVNARDPLLTREQGWWKTLRAIGKEVGLVRLPVNQDLAADLVTAGQQSRRAAREGRGRKGRGRGRLTGDRGSAAIETVGLIPSIFLVVAFCWQVAIVGVTFVWSGYAAQAASHAVQLGQDPGPVARDRVPGYFRDGMQVVGPSTEDGDRVRVSLRVPLFAPGVFGSPWTITSDRRVVTEPPARGGAF
jgi:pilus assembly protein CpaE